MEVADLTARKSENGPSSESLVAAMLDPEFYPKPPPAVTHRETHISHLFFAGDVVYKIKKPVRFSFLDFSTLAKRRYYIEQELRLNGRLAPSVYLGVVPIGFEGGRWELDNSSNPAEYALVMRRLPEKRFLKFLLETKQVTPEMMEKLAKLIAEFHASAKIPENLSPKGYLAIVEKYWKENLVDLEPFAGRAERDRMNEIKAFGADFLRSNRELLAQRVSQGRVRDVHGDLHAEHICFAPEGIEIFDCIEFSAELRCCDVASEIAFLGMDLAVRGGRELMEIFVAEYLKRANDSDLRKLLPFYACYRALVRAKVHALRLGRWNDETARYFRFAARVIWEPMKPFIVLVCGSTGSGKSTISRELASRLDVPLINSDVVRKQIASKAGQQVVPFNEGIYSPSMTEKTYATMAYEAEQQVAKGQGVVLDATFSGRAQRQAIVELAKRYGAPVAVIHCAATDATIERRLKERAAAATDVSDGRWEIYLAQKAHSEPLADIPLSLRLELQTDAPLEELANACEKFLRSRWAQFANPRPESFAQEKG
jgi:uncharacterized protein